MKSDQKGKNRLLSSIEPLGVRRTRRPVYLATVDGRTVELSLRELMSFPLFKRACVAQIAFVPRLPTMTDAESRRLPQGEVWDELVHRALQNLVELEEVPGASDEERWEALSEALLDRSRWTEERRELLEGRILVSSEHLFCRAEELPRHLKGDSGRTLDPSEIREALASRGDRRVSVRIGPERWVWVWKIPREALADRVRA